MSDRLRDPVGYIRARGWDSYWHHFATEITRRAPWSRPVLRAARLDHWALPLRDCVAARHLRGEGLEIGAQAAPLRLPSAARARYVDTRTREETLRDHPELDAAKVVSPDWVADGTTLAPVGDASQDFLIANHVLEHTPDPIGTLRNWLRVLRRSGILYCAVPIAELTFDRGRGLTSLGHMIEDFEVIRRDGAAALAERNRPHYDEWMRISNQTILRERGLSELPVDEIPAHVDWMVGARLEIHFHTFSAASFAALLRHVGATADRRASVLTVVRNGGEAIAITRRA